MPWNGSGGYTVVYNWSQDAANGIKILASRQDTQWADIATNGFGNTVTRDGQGSASANQPMNGYIHTGVGTVSLANQYTPVGQLQSGQFLFGVAGGSADAITGTFSPATTALTNGELVTINATAANATTTPTFAPDGLTAHTITKLGGTALAAGDIAGVGHRLLLSYSSTGTRWELLNPALSSGTVITVKDTNFSIVDDGDVTKIAKFQASGITTGTTRTYTFPDQSSTLAVLGAQTFTGTQTFASTIVFAGATLSATTGSGGALMQNISPAVTGTMSVAAMTMSGALNNITFTAPATAATLTLGNNKTFSVSNTLTLAGTDGSTLNVGAGGTLGSNAFTSTAYAPLASPTFTGTLTAANVTLASSTFDHSGGTFKILSTQAIPAGGAAFTGYQFSSATGFGIFFGSGSPTLAAAKGSLYLRSDGSTTNDRAYINTNGNTTWTALTTAA